MRKVLIITYYYPPRPGIGSQRPYNLAKYFSEFGWEPIVLTAKLPGKPPEGIRVIETDYKDYLSILKEKIGFHPKESLHQQLGIPTSSRNFTYPTWKSKVIKLAKEVINFPDDNRGWYKFALEAGDRLLSREKVDAILSTSGPATCHLIAAKLKQKYRIPWIADYRDPWSGNPYSNKFGIVKYFEKRLEVKTLSHADAIVTVTDAWVPLLQTLHKNKKVFCVTNGYDKEDLPKTKTVLTPKFTITHTGMLYNGKRDPSVLFEAIGALIKENKIKRDNIEVRFYGDTEDWLEEEKKKYNMDGIVNFYGFVPRKEALKRQMESQLLLLLMWNNEKEEGFCPGKVYEYFAAGRPIMAYGWSGSVVKGLLEKTNAGRFAGNAADLRDILLNYYEEFNRSGEVTCRSNDNVGEYAYTVLTQKYSEILHQVVSQ